MRLLQYYTSYSSLRSPCTISTKEQTNYQRNSKRERSG
uniref:Uncharacterized protein n=1 Tax=Rhizophora mucronata TaxID=61149 RepID=A0A2P2N2Y2_RHIMU